MKRFSKSLAVLAIACPIMAFLIASCAEESDCSTKGRPTLNGTFFRLIPNDSPTDSTILDSVQFLTIRAFYTDSIIFNAETNVSKVYLPLRYTTDSTVFVFQFHEDNPELADTVTIWHHNTPYFISVDCGYEVKQMITRQQSTRHYLNKIKVVNDNTNTNETENLQLILQPVTNPDDNEPIISSK